MLLPPSDTHISCLYKNFKHP